MTAVISPELAEQTSASERVRRPKSWKQTSAKWIRWVHIYISMFSCAVVLFFSATGLTLNHPTWFGGDKETVRETSGSLDLTWVAVKANATDSISTVDNVKRLEVVEHLRSEAHVRGAMKEFTVDETQCIVAFRAPGYAADAFIDRETGKYELVESSLGWTAIFNDLHKGRDSGVAWSWLIDFSAILLVVVSATGLLLLLYIKRHRRLGLFVGAAGMLMTIAFYVVFVPH